MSKKFTEHLVKDFVKDILTHGSEESYSNSIGEEDIEQKNDENPSDQRKDSDFKKNKETHGDLSHLNDIEKNDLKEGEEGEEEKGVFEVEAIIDHKKSGDKTMYLIKWEGYPEDQATWEFEKNVFAEDLIKDYWKKSEVTSKSSENAKSPAVSRTATTPKDKKRLSASSPVKKRSKNQHVSKKSKKDDKAKIEEIHDESDSDDIDATDNWEDKVVSVETVSRDEKGELLIYLRWDDGSISRYPAREANLRCPQKIIKFYEQRLTFAPPPNHNNN